MREFIPIANDELVNWLTNNKAKLALLTIDLELDTTQVDAQKVACDKLLDAIGTATAFN